MRFFISESFLSPTKDIFVPFIKLRGFTRYFAIVVSDHTRPPCPAFFMAFEYRYLGTPPARLPNTPFSDGPTRFFPVTSVWQALHLLKTLLPFFKLSDPTLLVEQTIKIVAASNKDDFFFMNSLRLVWKTNKIYNHLPIYETVGESSWPRFVTTPTPDLF